QNTVGTIDLTAGMHDIVIVFAQGGGGAAINLQWVPAGSTAGFVTVPTANLFTADPALANAVSVTGPSTLQLSGGAFATVGLGALTAAAGSSLTVSGLPGKKVTFTSTTVAGPGTVTVAGA